MSPGDTYDVAVRPVTQAGYGQPATARLVAADQPEPNGPTDVKVRRGNRKALVRWTAPASSSPITDPNGEAVLRYRVRVNGTVQTMSGWRFVVRNNRPGTYRIRVRGVNDVGVGRSSRLIVVRVARR